MDTNAELLDNARRLLETARTAAGAHTETTYTIRIGYDGAILMAVGDADAGGARMAFRVRRLLDGRVRVEGRAGEERCLLESVGPVARTPLMLANTAFYPLAAPVRELGQNLSLPVAQ